MSASSALIAVPCRAVCGASAACDGSMAEPNAACCPAAAGVGKALAWLCCTCCGLPSSRCRCCCCCCTRCTSGRCCRCCGSSCIVSGAAAGAAAAPAAEAAAGVPAGEESAVAAAARGASATGGAAAGAPAAGRENSAAAVASSHEKGSSSSSAAPDALEPSDTAVATAAAAPAAEGADGVPAGPPSAMGPATSGPGLAAALAAAAGDGLPGAAAGPAAGGVYGAYLRFGLVLAAGVAPAAAPSAWRMCICGSCCCCCRCGCCSGCRLGSSCRCCGGCDATTAAVGLLWMGSGAEATPLSPCDGGLHNAKTTRPVMILSRSRRYAFPKYCNTTGTPRKLRSGRWCLVSRSDATLHRPVLRGCWLSTHGACVASESEPLQGLPPLRCRAMAADLLMAAVALWPETGLAAAGDCQPAWLPGLQRTCLQPQDCHPAVRLLG
jgi:hypothetical protein